MIVRARKRDREIAVRFALGASRARVMRMLALEGALVGATSTLLGLITARLAMPLVGPLIERALERRVPGGLTALGLDAGVAAVVVACGIFVTVLFTLFPLAMVWRSQSVAVGASMRGVTDHPGAARSRALLIGLEVAASLTLLVGASLMAASAVRMLQVDFGIEGDQVVTAGLALRQRSFPDEASRAKFYQRLEAELGGAGGNQSVAFGDWWPLQGSRPRRAETGGTEPIVATANPFAVSPNYFKTLGIRLLDGRSFTEDDRLGREPVAMVSASLAARLWPRMRAVGQLFTIHPDGEGQPVTLTVVGVVNDVRQSHADTDQLDAYLSLAQRPSRFAFVYLRAQMAPSWEAELRSAIARVHPEVALGTPRSLVDGLEQERARPRFLAYLLTTFAVFACALALVGMYGVIAYAVRQRQREIAVRLAIGAAPRAITAMFLRDGALVLAAGLGVGVAGAVGLGRVLQSQLYGVRPAEPQVLAMAVVGFGVVALAAVLWPAWRAASTDAAMVLKQE
jgi:putative ABC transport system permease protein